MQRWKRGLNHIKRHYADRDIIIKIIIIIRIYYGAAQPVLSSALRFNKVIVDSGN